MSLLAKLNSIEIRREINNIEIEKFLYFRLPKKNESKDKVFKPRITEGNNNPIKLLLYFMWIR